jgi:peptidoglycan biosynthesis protein MviN/MurJ (putative lipid II flippase)
MWLIMTALAAIITTAIWYVKAPEDKYKVGLLSLFFWGATLMWLVDHVMAYLTEGGEFFEINLDATLLGVTVIVLALLVWEIILLVSDPKGVLKRVLSKVKTT